MLPVIHDSRTFKTISSTEKGIYAFFLDFKYLVRSLQRTKTPMVDTKRLFDKCHRAHTLSTPKNVSVNLYGKSRHHIQRLDMSSHHRIDINRLPDSMPTSQMKEIANGLQKCTLLTTPLYIGITDQSFRIRFNTHRRNFEKLKASGTPRSTDWLTPEGEFYNKMADRKLEFRDLLFVTVSLTPSEMAEVQRTEELLHAFVNPPLSTTH